MVSDVDGGDGRGEEVVDAGELEVEPVAGQFVPCLLRAIVVLPGQHPYFVVAQAPTGVGGVGLGL
jgi:hypothetical protein